ncbi:hypothetical protein CS063_02300 [Sporanaerobium hydrogeniformans]|uniref:Uncharacterized protein n=1 Tax=Sporanaerobium hydrogeniformans TaxID=3072179 RepID=A0AC61DHR9_9FIRM|nr:hypothetical protein [Sporanaerobium hydrogeniformans]PHV72328.1 hypothetical protein CS063_02300 [Sporanaerobium hydrogeniformans]
MAINVTVTDAQALDANTPNTFFDITFTNTNEFDYAENSNIYFYALLTDSTSATTTVTFTLPKTTAGTIAANTSTSFTFENTANLVPTVTASQGRILYVA